MGFDFFLLMAHVAKEMCPYIPFAVATIVICRAQGRSKIELINAALKYARNRNQIIHGIDGVKFHFTWRSLEMMFWATDVSGVKHEYSAKKTYANLVYRFFAKGHIEIE